MRVVKYPLSSLLTLFSIMAKRPAKPWAEAKPYARNSSIPDGVERSRMASDSELRLLRVEIADTATPVVDEEIMLNPNPATGIIIMMLRARLCAKISSGPVKLMLPETEAYISSAKDLSRGIMEERRKTVENRKTVIGKRPHFVWRNGGSVPLSRLPL